MTEKQRNMETDYYFLRDRGVRAITAIFMVRLAYKEDIVIVGRPKVIVARKGFRRRKTKT